MQAQLHPHPHTHRQPSAMMPSMPRWTRPTMRPHLPAKTQPVAALLLGLGLLVAIVTDGSLSPLVSRTLFGVLAVLNVIVVEWLTRPRA